NPATNDESSLERPQMVIKISPSKADQVFRCRETLFRAQWAETGVGPKIVMDEFDTYPLPFIAASTPHQLSANEPLKQSFFPWK
ncbi:uncharacterized protein A4U43_C09F7960, partial [Asparagus officinalis]